MERTTLSRQPAAPTGAARQDLHEQLIDGRDEDDIVALSLSGLAALGCFLPCYAYLSHGDALVRHPAAAGDVVQDETVTGAVRALRGADGELRLPGCGWSWAFALSGGRRHLGYLVVRASTAPTRENLQLARALARQTAAALTDLTLLRRERARAAELTRQVAAQTAVNAELRTEAAAAEHRGATLAALAEASASGEGEQGIVRALHDMTGLAAVSEDRFGNLRAWAGPGRPDPYPAPVSGHRQDVLRRAVRERRPVRDRDRLVVPARPHGEVLGVLALVDPDRQAGRFAAFALRHAAMALARELAHARDLAEVELRLRRDLVEDLVTGADEESAFARSEAVGHDLHGPHRVAVVHWAGAWGAGTVGAAVERAAVGLGLEFLLGRRRGASVLLLRGDAVADPLHKAVAAVLGSTAGAIGVGGRCDAPAGVPRSYGEALQALRVRERSRSPDGLTAFDELGIYRLLGEGDARGEAERFVDEWLGPLLDYDAAHHTRLVGTLSAYLDCGGGYAASAAALTIHRSTLRYRLQRIREITGLDLADVDVRLNLHVATRIWKVAD